MKRLLYKIALIVCAGLIFSSCDLDEVNPSAGDATLTSFTAWSGLQAYCYTALNDELYTASDWMFASETGTDLWLAKSNGTGSKELFYYENQTTGTNAFQKLFKQCYSMISSCNTLINEAGNITDGKAENIAQLVAETKTLRALYYSILVTNFGPVTLNLESSSSLTGDVGLYPKRSSEKVIYDQIIKDLTEAIPVLKVTPYDNNSSRFTKKSAMGLLARVYAQRAGLGASKYGDAATYWTLAATTAEDLITNAATYDAYLYTDIADMWADANNRTNKEALMIAGGPDGNKESWQYMTKRNKLAAYSSGGYYSEFFNSNHRPGDKGYFYGRLNASTWMPSKYLMYCFNPNWDKRWEYSFNHAWSEWSMAQCGWVAYNAGKITVNAATATKYGITNPGTIYPYADCNAIASVYAGNQYPAKIWPKGEISGDTTKLLSVAPSSEKINTAKYSGSTKAYAIPYPVDLDDNRINTIYVHQPLPDKSQCKYAVVVLSDLYDSKDYPYGGVAQGSDAGNPPNIGNGLTTAASYPSLIKFNWSINGAFVGSDLQLKSGNMFIMRMAEVYLLAAEARERLGQGAKAAEYLNVLRKRAARSNVAENEWRLTNATENDIFDEYARELCGEFSRWALLKRHNAFETRLPQYNKRAAISFKPVNYNRPISFDFLSTILNKEEYGDNGYGSTAKSGLEGIE